MNRRRFLHRAGFSSTALAFIAAGRGEPLDGDSKSVPEGQTIFEFLGRSDENGSQVSHYGYLTHVFGLADDELFSDPTAQNEATARLTYLAATTLDSRHELVPIITTSAPGTLTVFFNEKPGADFTNPASFSAGIAVASYSIRYHNVLDVLAPNQGIAAATAELAQIDAHPFIIGNQQLRLGEPGLRARLTANGSGTRTQEQPLQAFFLIGGAASLVDSK